MRERKSHTKTSLVKNNKHCQQKKKHRKKNPNKQTKKTKRNLQNYRNGFLNSILIATRACNQFLFYISFNNIWVNNAVSYVN